MSCVHATRCLSNVLVQAAGVCLCLSLHAVVVLCSSIKASMMRLHSGSEMPLPSDQNLQVRTYVCTYTHSSVLCQPTHYLKELYHALLSVTNQAVPFIHTAAYSCPSKSWHCPEEHEPNSGGSKGVFVSCTDNGSAIRSCVYSTPIYMAL